MADIDIKKLNKKELISLLLSINEQCEELETELEKAKERLKAPDIEAKEAGSLSKAVEKLAGIAAQVDRMSSDYIADIEQRYENQEEATRIMVEETKEHCAKIENEVRIRCNEMVEKARANSESYKEEINSWIEKYNKMRESLQGLLGQLPDVVK